jgi:hypothetical protein
MDRHDEAYALQLLEWSRTLPEHKMVFEVWEASNALSSFYPTYSSRPSVRVPQQKQ